ncbi:MAG TPA: choice-of-anchor L domain-containing protein [Saprospiraceae bacterium]|nr:choice-of-anchor L domain-containing protein [Saprospiraceae bacterium]HMQ81806.1 choice-of-anchor L domain-containing protein [Saprospiraceae bacterium]
MRTFPKSLAKALFSGLLSLFFTQQLLAQPLEVTNAPPITPDNLITNVFLGEGVEVIDVQFEGDPNAVGFFKNADDEIGIERGIVMSTGRAVGQGFNPGVEATGGQQSSATMASNINDLDLMAIGGGGPSTINDVCRYTITFIPIADTLRFRYVFGSEEYPEYVCSDFNDIFGFFISGPGISGPFQNNGANIALIPGTNLPVRINNVNPGVVGANGTLGNCTPPNGTLAFSEFYNTNTGTFNQPVFDGFTDVFTAEAIVMPCSTYTIKLVICDFGDTGWDSGVFLEAKSFGTGSLDVEATTVSLDGTLAEGCDPAMLTFSLPTVVESDFPIDYNIIGTAENGVDYSFIPPDLFIPAGDSVVSMPIFAFEDFMDEGLESIMIDVQRDVCNRDTFVIYIRENPLLPPDLGADTTICEGDSVQLDGSLPIVLPPPPTFSNTTPLQIPTFPGNVTLFSEIDVFGVIPPNLGPGVIQSICIDSLQHGWIDDLDLYLITPGGQFIELTTDNGGNGGNGLGPDYFINTCFTPEATDIISFNGQAPPTAVPFTGDWQPEGVWEDLYGEDKPTNGTWQLQITDDQQSVGGTLFSWTITFNPVFQVEYQWTPADGLSCTDCPNPVATPTTTTTYYLEATDSYGCSVYDTITIEVIPRLEAPMLTCGTITNNSITVVWPDVPGALGYEVSIDGGNWQPTTGNNQHQLNGLSLSTDVTFIVRAIGDCPGREALIICSTPNCTPPILSVNQVTDVFCYDGSDGAVSLSAVGGIAPFVYVLETESNLTGLFTDLPAGQYTAQVIDDTGCPGSVSFEIGQPDPLAVNPVLTNVSCFGEQDGTATLEIMGGSGPFTFEWSDGQTDSIAVNLEAEAIDLLVTDQNGCIASYTFEIAEPVALSATVQTTNVVCAGESNGTAIVSEDGGVLPYTVTYPVGTTIGATPEEAIDLASGFYNVMITDANNCQVEVPFEIAEPEPIVWQLNLTDATCAGTNNGTAEVTFSGGTGTVSIQWLDVDMNIIAENTATAANLLAGDYQVVLFDANNCTEAETFAIQEPQGMSFALDTLPASCFGVADGQATLNITGGTAPYSFNWSDIGVATNSRSDLIAGNYAVVVTDANDCTLDVQVSISSPETINVELSAVAENCVGSADGQASVVAIGGNGTYTYLWSDGQTTATAVNLPSGMVEVLVTDENGCERMGSIDVPAAAAITLAMNGEDPFCAGEANGQAFANSEGGAGGFTYLWSNGLSTATITDLPQGTYQVTVTDVNQCEAMGTITLEDPPVLSGSTSSTLASCAPDPDGTATVTPTGGTMPYTYLWEDGQTTQTALGFATGIYNVVVSDANGCQVSLEVEVESVSEITLSTDYSDVSCFGGNNGQASVMAEGGTGNYMYSWSNGASQSQLNNITAGNYTVTVTDDLGCTETASIVISQPDDLVFIQNISDVSCAGGADGAIAVQVTGGVSPYVYAWSSGQNTSSINNLPPGAYTLSVTDSNDCLELATYSVDEAAPIAISFETEAIPCYGQRSGVAEALVSGGVAPYAYQWSNQATTPAIESVYAGEYTLTLTDAAGCEVVEIVEITQPDTALTATLETMDVSCYGLKDGQIKVNVTGGTPGYRYSIDNGGFFSGSSNLIALAADEYQVLIRDANGCTFLSDVVVVEQPDPIEIDLGTTRAINYGDTIQLWPNITGGLPGYAYEWYPQDSAVVDCFTCPNPHFYPDYQVGVRLLIIDINDCMEEAFVTIYPKKFRPIYVPSGFTPNADNTNDRLIVHAKDDLDVDVLFFRIYDRWGELLFEQNNFKPNDTNAAWDGTYKNVPVEGGVYIWHVGVLFEDGLEENFSGNTTLIR